MFTDAVAQAEKLGGVCRIDEPRKKGEGKHAQCEYSRCGQASGAAGCEGDGETGTGPTLSSYPILSIGMLAAVNSPALTQIIMVYQGDAEAVAAGLIEQFGATEVDGEPSDEKSWSNARRWSWKQGAYSMGLLDSPHLIILKAGQTPASALDGRAVTSP
tara:strand:- start:2071 stop:2547 length:477 start_codon:yes stop_codon:yes gene_type:complete